MTTTITTANQLAEICYLMPKMPGIGTIYMGGLAPIQINNYPSLKEAYLRYLDFVLKKRDSMEELDFEMMRQYLIYYIHAPLWMQNPHLDEDSANQMQQLRDNSLKISNWDELRDFKWELMRIGLDPF